MKKKRHLAPFALALAVGMAASPATALTNGVDWASAPSVVAYLDALVEERGKVQNVGPEDLAKIEVSANVLWEESLNFELRTNDFDHVVQYLNHREKTVTVITRMRGFEFNFRAYTAATNVMMRLHPIVALGRGTPAARKKETIAVVPIFPEDTSEIVASKQAWNTSLSNEHHRLSAAYEEDQKYRNFYDTVCNFHHKIGFLVRHRFGKF